jgi:hypothetical protein
MPGRGNEDDAPVAKEVMALAESEIGPAAEFIDVVVLGHPEQ